MIFFVFLPQKTIMTKATILSLEQTEVAGLFTIIFEGEMQYEFVKFVKKF